MVRRIDYSHDRAVHTRLEDTLTAYNEELVGPGAGIQLCARNDAGEVIAGLSGAFWGTSAWVHVVWVDDDARRQGYGADLLAAFEDAARAAGCRQAMVSTYTFQDVLAFYTGRGYAVSHRVQDVPQAPYELLHLLKPLDRDAEAVR